MSDSFAEVKQCAFFFHIALLCVRACIQWTLRSGIAQFQTFVQAMHIILAFVQNNKWSNIIMFFSQKIKHLQSNVFYPAYAMRVTVLGCVCVFTCLSTLILALQANEWYQLLLDCESEKNIKVIFLKQLCPRESHEKLMKKPICIIVSTGLPWPGLAHSAHCWRRMCICFFTDSASLFSINLLRWQVRPCDLAWPWMVLYAHVYCAHQRYPCTFLIPRVCTSVLLNYDNFYNCNMQERC